MQPHQAQPLQQQQHRQHQQQQWQQVSHWHHYGSSHGTVSSAAAPATTGPRAKCDQVVFEAIAKACEIVVQSRCWIGENGAGGATTTETATSTTTTKTTSSSSGRFNLEVKEVEEVRMILQRWKRSLHVPIRLDFYYEYDGPGGAAQRQWMERWCIDYVASSDPASLRSGHDDTIAQLRQVCKRVVILLRSLLCLTRIMPGFALHRALSSSSLPLLSSMGPRLPSHTSPSGRVTFSLYVFGQEEAAQGGTTAPPASDATGAPGLMEQAGGDESTLRRHELASIPTPFGMLHFTALYDAALDVSRLLSLGTPKPATSLRAVSVGGEAAPRQRTPPRMVPLPHSQSSTALHPRSLPTRGFMPAPAVSTAEAAQALHPLAHEAEEVLAVHPLSSVTGHQHHQNGTIVSRRLETHAQEQEHHRAADKDADEEGVTKVLSGLSLAMMADEEARHQQQQEAKGDSAEGSNNEAEEQARRRRIALHHPPPSMYMLPMSTEKPLDRQRSSSSDLNAHHGGGLSATYGYGYNAAIRLPPATNSTATPNLSRPSPSPALTGVFGVTPPPVQTPPQPAHIGATPPFSRSPYLPAAAAGGTSTAKGKAEQDKPRAVGFLTSPPFENHPLTLQEPPEQSWMASGAYPPTAEPPQHLSQPPNNEGLLPLTSLDLLPRDNPFQAVAAISEAAEKGGASLLSSLSMGAATAHGSVMVASFRGGAAMNASLAAFSSSAGVGEEQAAPSFDDMPFAVDDEAAAAGDEADAKGAPSAAQVAAATAAAAAAAAAASSSASSSLLSSQIVTSFAHKCATASRLKMFGEGPALEQSQSVAAPNFGASSATASSVGDALAEFRTFGATLAENASATT